VRPKKQRRLSALDLVQLAAERQIQRVIAKSPLHMMENSNMASHLSNAASNQTILTSHISQEESKVVAESPPVQTAMSPAFAVAGGVNKKPTAVKPAPVVRFQRSL
jgi:hypothetical protein